ncbi:unnamed protein product [Phytophthora fragariaefolia]|uniref:Unnamed protein product n=1 Tax=Phytophthora fragariaefolia TaxID=1490495 RepID=A0A9W7CMV7_9STRA|nr:unnamed protein product [Phytophthora fragariaefolia]
MSNATFDSGSTLRRALFTWSLNDSTRGVDGVDTVPRAATSRCSFMMNPRATPCCSVGDSVRNIVASAASPMTGDSRWSVSHSGSARWGQSSRATYVATAFGLPVDMFVSTGRLSAPRSRGVAERTNIVRCGRVPLTPVSDLSDSSTELAKPDLGPKRLLTESAKSGFGPNRLSAESAKSELTEFSHKPSSSAESPGDTTSDAEHESARQVTLESLECLLRFQASQREQELVELTRFVVYSLTRRVAPSDRAQREALLSVTTIHELGDALRRQFAGPDSATVIADLRTELQVVQQINAFLTRRLDTQPAELADLQGQLKVMTLGRDRLLDLSTQSTAFSASLRKSVAELEAQVASARVVPDAEVAAAFRYADDFKRQVLDRDQEIATLRASIVDRDRAYATLQGVATNHFTQLQESARLLTDGGSQPLRHT